MNPALPQRRARRDAASVQLSIDEVVLHGFTIDRQDALADALREELTRLFADRIPAELLKGNRTSATVTTPTIRFAAKGRGADLGHSIARAVFGALSPAPCGFAPVSPKTEAISPPGRML